MRTKQLTRQGLLYTALIILLLSFFCVTVRAAEDTSEEATDTVTENSDGRCVINGYAAG